MGDAAFLSLPAIVARTHDATSHDATFVGQIGAADCTHTHTHTLTHSLCPLARRLFGNMQQLLAAAVLLVGLIAGFAGGKPAPALALTQLY